MSSFEVVITGLGVVSPLGVGKDQFWESLSTGRSGIGPLDLFDPSGLPIQIAGQVREFNPKPYIRNRKSLKLMCRDIQMGVAAARMACDEADIASGKIAPERLGVVLGADRICNPIGDSEAGYRECIVDGKFVLDRWAPYAMPASFPLGFLRVLPNMVASHVSIAEDARGPNNTIHQGSVSSLLAIQEAARVIARGDADVMIAGGASSQMDPFDWIRHCAEGRISHRNDDPASASRPFDANRDGQVWGEGAATVVLESRRHAESRGAVVLARLLGWAATCQANRADGTVHGEPIVRAMATAMQRASVSAADLGHVNAHGLGTLDDDPVEAQAIHAAAPGVPVTAPKSYFGNLAAAGGAVELVGSVLSFAHKAIPPTLNYEEPDPLCPIDVVRGKPLESSGGAVVKISWSRSGHAAAVVLGSPD